MKREEKESREGKKVGRRGREREGGEYEKMTMTKNEGQKGKQT